MSRVCVLGNAGVDLLLALPALARPGETVVATGARRAPGGKGLNQAVAAARAGARVDFLAPVGRDGEAEHVASALAAEPLAGLHLLPVPAATDLSIVMVAPDGENCIVTQGGAADALTPQAAAGFAASVGPEDWLLLQGNLSLPATLAAVRASRGRVALNAAPLRWSAAELLPHCAVVVANRVEAREMSGHAEPDAAARWLHAQGCRVALVTLGAGGCVWADAGGSQRQPAAVAAALDTSGAGDVCCGVLLAGLADGVPFAAAVAAAQAAAGLSVTRQGAFQAIPSAAELRRIRAA